MNTIFLKKYFGVLQRVGKSLMLPVALLPAAGLLMGIGTLLQNPNIINNIPMLSGMSNGDGVAALAAIVSFLIMNMTIGITARVDLLQVDTNPMYDMVLGIPTLQTGVFGGILIGMVSAIIYQKFYTIKLPEFLGFFSGKRFVPIVAAIAGVLIGIIMVVIWPPIQNFLLAFSRSMIGTNQTVSALIFGIVERALIPFGLHHIWYNPFWYQFGEYINSSGQLIIGDQAIFFAQLKEGVEFTAGTFMTGKFPFMMFGLPAAALAMYHEADSDKKKLVAGILFSGALTSFLTGITEPIEFMFLFVAPVLFGVHCIFAGLSFMIMQILNVKVGLTFSGGLIDFILFGVLPNRTKWWWIIIVGIIFAAIYYIGFRYIIRKLDLKTPGREREESEIDIDITDGDLAYNVLDAFGGVKNIKYLDACITRVRVTVKNISLVNRSKLKSLGSADLMIIGDNIQAIFGPKSDMLKEQMKDIIDGKEVKVKKKKNIEKIEKGLKIESSIMMPVTGKLLRLEEVPDPIFSMKLIGDGFAIDPKKNILISPIKGMILTISKTSHSITIRGLDGFDIFIHIGIDSINLNGNGFKAFVQEGDIVNEGDLLIEFPLDEIREKLKSPMIPVIFKGLSKEKFIYFNNDIDVKSGDINKVEIHEKLNN